MPKKQPEFHDILGRTISIGDAVVINPGAQRREKLWAGRVDRFTRKKISVSWTSNGHVYYRLVFPQDAVIIPMEDYLMHALSRN